MPQGAADRHIMSHSVAVILLSLIGTKPANDMRIETRCCGRYALAVVAGFLNPEDRSEAWECLLPSASGPFSLAQLDAAARSAGYDTLLVRWTDGRTADLRRPCILFGRRSQDLYALAPGACHKGVGKHHQLRR